MKRFIYFSALATIAFFAISPAKAQDKKIPADTYLASAIPDSLKEDANSVVRYYMEDMNVKGPGDAVVRVHSIVTILNEKGSDEAEKGLPYNKKFNSVGSFEMKVYNAAGLMIKKYKKSDMYDRSAVSGSTIVSDDRVLILSHTIASYPTTIEITFDEDLKSLIGLGDWGIQKDEQSVQNAFYHISISNDAGFRFLNKNTLLKPEKVSEGKTDSYLWSVANLKAIKLEARALDWKVLPRIYFAADNFEYYGLPGSISSWRNYGKWQQMLNSDVGVLDASRVEEVKKMTAGVTDDKEKVRILYEFLQQNMRYVSIQLGIGGLKPFPASFVDQKKYGDCKALSNYMVALLHAVNIPAYYAKVRAGANEQPYEPSFPTDMSNHIIVCVPLKGDTTWLECTSNTQAFGKLGSFTENRNALLITEDGGKLVNTPKSISADNQFNCDVHITLSADGAAKAVAKVMASGVYRDDYISLGYLKADEQKEQLIRSLGMKQPTDVQYTAETDKGGIKQVDIVVDYDKFYDIAAGNKQFLRPRLFDIWQATFPVTEKRKYDYYFEQPLQKTCVTTFDLPEGFEVENMPTNQALKFSYGNYEVNYVYNAAKNQVVSTAKFNLTSHVIPAAKYTEMQVYMDNVAKAQNKKLVIRKKA